MKFLRQFMIILLLSFLGEVLKMFIPLPIPASVYGLVLMLVCLMTGVLKTSQVKDAAFFLIEIMPVMFIPAAAGLIDSWKVLQPIITANTSHYCSDHSICYGNHRKSSTNDSTEERNQK